MFFYYIKKNNYCYPDGDSLLLKSYCSNVYSVLVVVIVFVLELNGCETFG